MWQDVSTVCVLIILWSHIYLVSSMDFFLSSPHFLYSKFQRRSMTPDKPASCRHRSQRSKADLIFKTLFYIMHKDHPFLNLHSQNRAPATCSSFRGTRCCLQVLHFSHCVFKIISNDTQKEKKKGRKDNKQLDISGVLMGTLCVSCLFCDAVFHYFWVHKISTPGRKERNKREKVAHPQGRCWFGERNKRIIPFDVRNKSSRFAALMEGCLQTVL